MDMGEEYPKESRKEEEKAGRPRQENAEPQHSEAKNGSNQDIRLLLEKINLQLENMRLADQNHEQTEPAQNNETGLEKLVTQLLETNNSKQTSTDNEQPQQSSQKENANSLLDNLLQQTNAKSDQQKNKPQNKNNDTVVLKTAAEVLSRAQYELSNELENSLKKLKQVISESEQIASKISNLIEQKQQ
jgi:hypothetical protein